MTNNDDVQYTLSVGTATISEASGSVVVTIGITGGVIVSTPVITLGYAGSATNGADYIGAQVNPSISVGQTSISFTLTGVQDIAIEGSEDIVIDIVSIIGG